MKKYVQKEGKNMDDVLNLNNKKENSNSNTIAALREEVVKNAQDILNRKPRPRYVWGATGPNSYDCSGFTSELLKKSGITIPRVSAAQGNYVNREMDKSKLKPGDLVFFQTVSKKPNQITHVGVYIGNGKFIDSGGGGSKNGPRNPGHGVRISDLNSSYWSKKFMGGTSLEKIAEKSKYNAKGKSTIKKEMVNNDKTLSAPQKTNVNSKRLEKCLDYIFQVEGGYSNHPNDKGGATKYGIIQAEARRHGYTGDMKNFTKDKAKEIYTKDYYYKNKLDQIKDDRVALSVFDWTVNSGGAKKEIQKMLNNEYGYNLSTDGVIGEQTLAALNAVNPDSLLKSISTTQRKYYDALVQKNPKNKSFQKGWHNRIARKEDYIKNNFLNVISGQSLAAIAAKSLENTVKDRDVVQNINKAVKKAIQDVKKSSENVRQEDCL